MTQCLRTHDCGSHDQAVESRSGCSEGQREAWREVKSLRTRDRQELVNRCPTREVGSTPLSASAYSPTAAVWPVRTNPSDSKPVCSL